MPTAADSNFKPLPTPSPTTTPMLVEGIDYTIEAGRWVFTAAFHLKRGHCCGSGCRHCPFRDQRCEKKDSGRRDSNPHEG